MDITYYILIIYILLYCTNGWCRTVQPGVSVQNTVLHGSLLRDHKRPETAEDRGVSLTEMLSPRDSSPLPLRLGGLVKGHGNRKR